MNRLILLFLIVFSFVSCKDGQLEEIAGKYQGDLIYNGKKDKVILEFPLLSKNQIQESFRIHLSSLNSLLKFYDINLVLKKDKFYMNSARLGIKNTIEVNESCDGSKNSSNTFCFGANRFLLSIKNPVRVDLNLSKVSKFKVQGIEKEYSKDELLIMAKYSNYEVQAEALRTFSSFNKVKSMKQQLLPKISMGTVLDLAIDGPSGLIGAVGDLLPFLFPSNWFQKQSSEELHMAQKYSYSSTRANAMNLVESLYYLVQRDHQILTKYEEQLKWMEGIHKVILKEEEDFIMPQGSALFFEKFILELKQDKILLASALNQELASLAQSVGLSPLEGVKILKEKSSQTKLELIKDDARKLFKKARDRSFEIKTVDRLIAAAKLDVKTQSFSFLDPSSSDSLGFNYGTEITIAKNEVNELVLSKDELLSRLEENLVHLTSMQEQYKESLEDYKKLVEVQTAKVANIMQKHVNGTFDEDEIDFINELVVESNELLAHDISKTNVFFSNLVNKSKIERNILEGPYVNLEINTPY